MIKDENNYHQTVMLKEVVYNLPVGKIIDCTLGTAGHTLGLIEKGSKVLGIEADPKILEIAKERINAVENGNQSKLVLGNFSNIENIAKENGFEQVNGIVLDLGVSNLHLKDDDRGFSFTEKDQELDMRLNPETQGVRAYDLLNALNSTQLINMFAKVMKYHDAKKLAEKVISNRPIKTVGELKNLAFGIGHKQGLDSATLPMLALRIAVNSELENLEEVLPKAYSLLKKGGKLLIITFHSGEDKIIKNFTNGKEKVILPSENEIFENRKSRSAKLYIYEKN